MGQTTQWPKEKDRNFLKVLGGGGKWKYFDKWF